MYEEDRKKIESRIIEFLKQNPYGATISEISRHLKINRITLSKYLDVLRVEGILDYKTVGRAKLWFVNDDISILEIILGKKDLLKSVSYDDKGFLSLADDTRFLILSAEIIQDLYILARKYNLYNLLEELGARLGSHVAVNYKIYSGVKEDVSEDIVRSLVEFLFRAGFGRVQEFVFNEKKKEVILTLDTNIIVEELSQIMDEVKFKELEGKGHCLIIKGYLKGLLENLFNTEFQVEETKCKLKGDEYCEFVASPKE